MSSKHLLFGLAAMALASSAFAANRPAGYVTICTEGKTCSVSSSTNVAFGRSGQFFYKTLAGSFTCNEATFGGRVAGGTNECSVPSGTSTSSASSVSSSKSSSSKPPASSSSSKSSVSSSKSSSSTSSSTVPPNSCKPGSVITNATVDCGGITVGTSCAGGSESQQPIFTLVNATIKNVHIAAGQAADGIHCTSGNCRAENVVWDEVCEDAATLMDAGVTFTISGGSASNAKDKTFQHNAKNSTYIIENFQTFGQVGKLYRSCGDCNNNGGPRYVNINNVTINGTVTSTVVGLNRNYGDKATIRNLKVKGLVWTSATTSKPRICEEWFGISKGNGSTQKYGEFFNTQYCDVSPSDVTSF